MDADASGNPPAGGRLSIVSTHIALDLMRLVGLACFIDDETIMLLIGMMGIVAVLKKTGFFALITVRIAKLTGGQPLRILILFCTITAVISAFLDNVTTVLIMVPIIIELTRGMGLTFNQFAGYLFLRWCFPLSSPRACSKNIAM